MARGRKADPAELQAAKGNPGRRPTGSGERVQLPPVVRVPPKSLSHNAREIWLKVAVPLAQMNLLRETDIEAMARWCSYAARWWDLEREIRRKGSTYVAETAHGGKRELPRPQVRIQKALEASLVALEDRLALTPRARQEAIRGLAALPPELPLGDRPAGDADRTTPVAASPIGLLAGTEPVVH